MVAFLKKPEESARFHQIVDFLNFTHIKYALTKNPIIYVLLIHQFWQTASTSTSENGEMEITATIDERVKTVTKASIRRHLKLEDSDGISTLPNTEIFMQLALIRVKDQQSQLSPITHPPMLHPPRNHQLYHHLCKQPMLLKRLLPCPHDSPLPRVYSLGSDEGSMTLNELTIIMKVKKWKNKVKSKAKLKKGPDLLFLKMRKGRHEHDFEFIAPKEDYTAKPDISNAYVPVSIAGAEVITASLEVKTAAESLVYIRRSATKRKDKGKAIMKEAEPVQKKTKFQLEQERLRMEEALRLQEQLDK
ncbi:hypothetical protein Tco_0396222 [Tanacetum coccineum]